MATSIVDARLAQVQSYRHSLPDLPREAIRGYPVPIAGPGDVFLQVPFFLRKGSPPAPPEVSAFGWIVTIDVATGARIAARRLSDALPPFVGVHQISPPMQRQEFAVAEVTLYARMSDLLAVAANPQGGVPVPLQPAAAQFRELWHRLAHRPLAAQYQALNPDWFATLRIYQ